MPIQQCVAAITGLPCFDERLPRFAWVGMSIIVISGLLAKWQSQSTSNRPSGQNPELPAEQD